MVKALKIPGFGNRAAPAPQSLRGFAAKIDAAQKIGSGKPVGAAVAGSSRIKMRDRVLGHESTGRRCCQTYRQDWRI